MLVRFFTIALLTSLGYSSIAQDWQLVTTKGEFHYSVHNKQNYYAIKIDSIDYSSGDSVLYNYKTFHEDNYDNCKHIDTSWIGSKVIIDSNRFTFYNKSDDEIIFFTDVQVADTWKLFIYSDSSYLLAMVEKVDTSSFVELTDSVKTISLQYKDKNGNPISSIFNNKEIMWSKQYGIVKGYNFNNFPNDTFEINLAGITTNDTISGVQNLDVKAIYNFEVGTIIQSSISEKIDVFYPTNPHYTLEEDSIGEYYIIGDTIFIKHFYMRRTIEMYSSEGWSDIEYDTLFEKINTANNVLNDICLTPVFKENQSGSMMQFLKKEFSLMTKQLNLNYIYLDSCFMPEPPEFGNRHFYIYHQGLGGGFGYSIYHINGGQKTLQYYKKGEEIYGTRFNINTLSISEKMDVFQVKVYPNPAESQINFNPPKKGKYSLEIYDVLGKTYQSKIFITSTSVDISNYPSGIYYYTISNGIKSCKGKFVKK